MALYALGDLHLSFQSDKSMDIFGSVWKRHERKIEKYVNRIVKPDDTLVLTGDHSWGRKLPECREDLAFIERLPGRKILLRGNHDMFWDAKKTERLNEEYKDRLFFLQNNFAVYEDYALVGTKGFTFEGPFYLDRWGNITGWDEKKEEQAEKLVARGILPPGGGRGIQEVHYVSSLSADKYTGRDLAVYGDCGRVRRFRCCLFTLSWGEPFRRQHPGRVSRDSIYASVG